MATPVSVPRLGWNMEEGTFAGWLKADGEQVNVGDALFILEGEKAAENIESFDAGILHIPTAAPQAGAMVAVGSVIGYLLAPGEEPPVFVGVPPLGGLRDAESPATTMASEDRLKPELQRKPSTPRARRTATRLGVDWRAATGTGSNGRIRERDVRALTPGKSLRRVIAERLLASQRATVPVTLMTTADATNLVRLRTTWAGTPKPSFTDLFVKLSALALQQHPTLNARWENERVVLADGIHISIAVDTDAGLLVPVLRDVPALNMSELATRSRDLIDRARQRQLSASELQGGTFTVTSLGSFGIDAFTPVINAPECAILGVGRIRRVPVVIGDGIAIRDQVTLSLTFDHRITDGAPAARFLQTLTAALENPDGVR